MTSITQKGFENEYSRYGGNSSVFLVILPDAYAESPVGCCVPIDQTMPPEPEIHFKKPKA